MLNYIEYLELPLQIALVPVTVFFAIQAIGELLEFKGKIVPEFMRVRKFFSRRKMERIETKETLDEVKRLLNDVNSHYSADNMAKRDNWMKWVNERAAVYDNSIIEINAKLSEATQALKEDIKITEEVFIQSSRDRVIDFAAKVSKKNAMVSREEFNRIFKVYSKYEAFLADRGLTNGEIDIAYRIIQDAYETRLRDHAFIEDARGYTNNG